MRLDDGFDRNKFPFSFLSAFANDLRPFGWCLLFHCRMFAVGWIGSRVCTVYIPLPHLQGRVMKFFLIEGFPWLDLVLTFPY